MKKKMVFLGMGGTIAGRAERAGDNVGYRAGQLPLQDLLADVPGLTHLLGGCAVLSEQVAQLDSKDMGSADWLALAERVLHYLAQSQVQGVVITHGTDTLEETAYFLAQTLPVSLLHSKPVVLTCAMRPASATFTDGPLNLMDAVCVAATAGVVGVVVVCAGKVHAADAVQKVHPYRLDAFDSGDAAPLGYVEESVLRCTAAWPLAAVQPRVTLRQLREQAWPRVEIVNSYAGVDAALVQWLLESAQPQPVRGIVVSAPGNGSIHRVLLPALVQAQQRGVRVVRVSRCAYGQIVVAPPAAADVDANGNADHFDAYALSPHKARIRVQLELALRDQQQAARSADDTERAHLRV